jgi:hypothetical protein
MTDPAQLPAPLAGGTTPHGLRYPGGDDPLYNVPAYLQNLANDIDGKVQHAGSTPTRAFAHWTGMGTWPSSYPRSFIVTFGNIRWVRGAIVSRQTWSGGTTQPVYLQLSPMWETYEPWNQTYWNKLYIMAFDPLKLIDTGDGHKYPDYFVGSAGLTILAWGDPEPVS